MKFLSKTCVLIVFFVIVALSEAGKGRSKGVSRPSSGKGGGFFSRGSKKGYTKAPSYPTQQYHPGKISFDGRQANFFLYNI